MHYSHVHVVVVVYLFILAHYLMLVFHYAHFSICVVYPPHHYFY